MTLESMLLIGVLGLVTFGLYALLMIRNLLKVVIGLQLIFKGAALALVLAGGTSGQLNLGQSLAVTVIVVDTVTAIVALALAVRVQQHCGTLDTTSLSSLRG